MRVTAYYVLRARPELLERLGRGCPEILPHFSAPALWTRSEGGSAGGDVAEWLEQLKLSFLLGLQAHLDELGDERLSMVIHGALGAPPWGADTFDRGWTAERFGGVDEYADEVARVATSEQLHKLTGSDAWRERLLAQRKAADGPTPPKPNKARKG
jgi:hypothetical protein